MATNSSIALITGGTSGIGRAAANKLAQLGIHVLVVGRNAERGEKTVAEIRAAGGKADFIASDLRDASSARDVARRAVEVGNGKAASSPCLRPGSTLALRGRGFHPALDQGDAHAPLEPQHKVPRPNGRGLNG